MERLVRALLVLSLLWSVSCTSSEASSEGERRQLETETFEGISSVRPKRVPSPLTPERVEKCLDERVDIDSIAGMYTSPIDMTEGQVEEARTLEVSVSNIAMLDKSDFAERLAQNAPRKTRDHDLANRWLLWGLGYVPLGQEGSSAPPGGGADLVAGFYDPRSAEIVIKQEGELDDEYITLAHEIAHAAGDQNFGLKGGTLRLIDDAHLAYEAVIEGDATLVELRFASQFSKRKLMEKAVKRLVEARSEFIEDRSKGTPQGIIDQFVFPYQYGLTFVCNVYKKRGWRGVNKLYKDPPTNTADIMFPERYLSNEKPGKPARFGRLGERWDVYAKGTIGPATLMSMFDAPADDEKRSLGNALGRAAAWNGGAYKVWAKYENAIDHVIAFSFVEHPDQAGVLCSSLAEWYEATYPLARRKTIADGTVSFSGSSNVGGSHLREGVLACGDGKVRLGIAPEHGLAKMAISL